jgi:hypothetical protein
MSDRHIECNECNFIGIYNPNQYRFKRIVYDLGDGAVAPVKDRISWCYDCANFAWIEKPVSQEDITAMLADYAQTGKTDEHVFHDDLEFAGEVLKSETQWRLFAIERKGSRCRCITCGSTNTETEAAFDYFSSGKIDAFRHPGCGGKLRVVESKLDIHIYWKSPGMDEREPRAIFSRDGLVKIVEGLPKKESAHDESSADELFIPEYEEDEQTLAEPANGTGVRKCKSKLLENPFSLLDASNVGNFQKIHEQAESSSRTQELARYQEACRALAEPDLRLAAELSWVPGLSVAQTASFIKYIHSNVGWWKKRNLVSITELPILSSANLLAALLEMLEPDESADAIACTMLDLATHAQDLDPNEIMLTINGEREAAGFPPVALIEDIESGLLTQGRYYRHVVGYVVDMVPEEKMDEVISIILDVSAGERYPLIGHLFERYEAKADAFLRREAALLIENVDFLKEEEGAFLPEATVKWFDHMIGGLREWDAEAKQLRLNLRGYGLEHELSHTVAQHIQELVALLTAHNRLDLASHLADVLQALFDGMPEFVYELVSREVIKDAVLAQEKTAQKSDIKTTVYGRKTAGEIEFSGSLRQAFPHGGKPADAGHPAHKAGPATEGVRQATGTRVPHHGDKTIIGGTSGKERPTAEVSAGIFFKKRFRLFSAGFEWQKQWMDFKDITWITWGGAPRHDQHGRILKKEMIIRIGNDKTSIDIKGMSVRKTIAVVQHLWPHVCTPLSMAIIADLESGKTLSFGDVKIDDGGVYLFKRTHFARDPVYCPWPEVDAERRSDGLVIFSRREQDMYVKIYYLEVRNAHLLEMSVIPCCEEGVRKISDLYYTD